MSKNATAGRISINLSAGTAQFVVDMEKANAKIRDFGAGHKHTVSDVQATSAALRTLEGGITNNLRAAENFLAKTLNLGSALRVAFPVVGAIALAGVVSELIGKANEVYEAFQKMKDAPKHIADEFRAVNAPLQIANDQLEVLNVRLENEIAKLQGKPQNNLKLALAEAREAADQLAESLDKALTEREKLLKDNRVPFWQQIVGNQAGTDDIADSLKAFHEQINKITADGQRKLAQSNTPGLLGIRIKVDPQKAAEETGKQIDEAVKAIKEKLIQKQSDVYDTPSLLDLTGTGAGQFRANADQRAQALKDAVNSADLIGENAKKQIRHSDLEITKDGLPPATAAAPRIDPVKDKIQELQSALRGAKEEAGAAGTDLFTEALAKSAAEADRAITELNKRLSESKRGGKVSLGDQVEITALTTQIALQGVQKKTADEQKRFYEEGAHEADLVNERIAESIQKRDEELARMDEQIAAARQLAAAETQGAEAVFRAQLKINLAKIADPDIKAKTGALDEAEHAAAIEKTVAQINRETDALGRRTAAVLGGVQAQREAALEDIRQSGEAPDVIAARVKAQQAQYKLEDATQLKNMPASAGVKAYFQEMVDHAQSAAMQVKGLLTDAFNSVNDTLARAVSGQKVSWASLFQGLSADLAKMALQNAEVNLVKGIGGKLGQGSNQPWSEKAPGGAGGIGGTLGGIFLNGAGKRDGSSQASALYVQIAGMGQNTGQFPRLNLGGRPSLGGDADLTDEDLANLGDFKHSELAQLAGDESGDSGGGGFLGAIGGFFKSLLFGGFRADGGSVDPGQAYMVGERGPEMWVPPSKGTIIPNHQLGGSGPMYYIDARGANAADVEQRVQQSLVAVHGSAVKNSAAVQAEMSKRKPLGAR